MQVIILFMTLFLLMGASKCSFLEEEESKGSTTSTNSTKNTNSRNTNSKDENSPENDLPQKIVVVTDLKNVDIILSEPSSYPNSDTTPTFTVINLNSGDTVKLYSGDNCDSMTNGFATVGPNQDSIQITLSDINGFDEKSISGKVTNEQGNESNCTNNLTSYQVENPVSGLMSSNISLSEPTSSTNIDDTPTFLVTDIEEGNTVNIYSGDNCNGDFSGSGIVAAGENSVEITIAPITETGSYSFSATISDHDGNTSNCSGGLINYKLVSSSTFISTWKTFSDNEEISIPMVELNSDGSAFNYDYTINWGDGSDNADVTSYDDPDATHVYSDQGEYNVTIIRTMETIKCFGSDSKDNLISIPNLGAVGWTSFEEAFFGCGNLGKIYGGNLSNVTTTFRMFRSSSADPDTKDWDVSNVTDMRQMFRSATADPDVSGWVTSNVERMDDMFSATTYANPDVSGWDTSNVENMAGMFNSAEAATPVTTTNENTWNTHKVTSMANMFNNTKLANPDVSGWKTSNVTTMAAMFHKSKLANPDVSTKENNIWDVSNVTTMQHMFQESESATLQKEDGTTNWNTHKVQSMQEMFRNALVVNPDVSKWDTSNVTKMAHMFDNADAATPVTTTDGNIWNTHKVVSMGVMFYNTALANPDVSGWDTSNVTNMGGMFQNALFANPVTTTNGNI